MHASSGRCFCLCDCFCLCLCHFHHRFSPVCHVSQPDNVWKTNGPLNFKGKPTSFCNKFVRPGENLLEFKTTLSFGFPGSMCYEDTGWGIFVFLWGLFGVGRARTARRGTNENPYRHFPSLNTSVFCQNFESITSN